MRFRHLVLLILASLVWHRDVNGQTKYPPETRNAALRYWFAFAEVQDPPADKATQDLLEKVATGGAAWDEGKLGPILDANEAAILTMQRATKLPDCDWGLDYDEGPKASIAYAPRARVLARLNTLHGMRAASKGDMQRAVDAWLAGVRFSQDVAKGGTLIFSFIASSAMLPNLNALTHAAQTQTLNAAQRKQIAATVRQLPETGFDWGEAMRLEEAGVYVFADQTAQASNSAQYFTDVMGKPASGSFALPSSADRLAYHKLMLSVEAALREPPQAATQKLSELDGRMKSAHWYFQQVTPKFSRSNEMRSKIAAARLELLRTLAS